MLVGAIQEGIGARAAGAVALAEPLSGYSLRYDDLLATVDRIASQLRAVSVGPGSRVGLLAANGPEVIATFLGLARTGAAAAPINPALTPPEVRQICKDLGLTAMVADPEEARSEIGDVCRTAEIPLHSLVRTPRIELAAVRPADGPNAEPSADDVCLLLQTSGTTSKPKTVPLKQRNLLASARNIADFYSLSPVDTTYCVMPLFHVHGLIGTTLSTLVSGGTVVVPRRVLASRFGSDLADHGVSWVSAVPTLLAKLTRAPLAGRLPALRFGRTSSSALPRVLVDEFEAKTGVPLVEAYGMTEASHQMASNPLPPRERRVGTVGVATGTRVAILDSDWRGLPSGEEGEVAVSGPGVIDAYLGNPRANEESFRDGWFRTGDVGRLSPDGYLTLVARIKELINRGGEKIAPREIDEVLLSHGAVKEAVAYGVADAKYGEVVHAAVVTNGAVAADELLSHCRVSLAAFKVPSRLVFLDAIPKGPTGKVQRALLADKLSS
jgi:oxalate---CoA ligase